MNTIISTALGVIVSTIVTYIITKLKSITTNYKNTYDKLHNDVDLLKKVNLSQVKSSLTNTFFAYDEIEKTKGVPSFIKENWIEEYDNYKLLGGNHYMETLLERVENWKTYK